MDARFATTHWSLLLELRDPTSQDFQAHLNALIAKYWTPVFCYALALRRISQDDARDVTQQFFTMLLARQDLQKLSPDRGSFRGFLKTALKNFLASADRAKAARPVISLPFDEAAVQIEGSTPDEVFDKEWGRAVLKQAVAQLKDSFAAEGKPDTFELFREYCLVPSGMGTQIAESTSVSYADLAARHNISEDDVRNRLRVARLRIRDILGQLLKEYLGPGGDVETELAFILSK